MNAPRRWLDDPDADETLRSVLRGASRARPLDQLTRRRLGAKVARASAFPAAAASWLFVKSATAALTVVLGSGAVAVATGVIDWGPSEAVQLDPQAPKRALSPAVTRPISPAASAAVPIPEPEPEPELEEPRPQLNPTPSLPIASSAGTLSAEAAILEQARRQMRAAPALALVIAGRHAARFPRGQLSSERALIQIEALHRLGRDAEARTLSRALLGGAGVGLYAERVHQLLGESAEP